MTFEIVSDGLRVTIILGLVIAGILAILLWVRNKTQKVSTLRLFIQIAAVPLIFLGLIIGPFSLPQVQTFGSAPRDALVGTNIFGVPFPDGLPIPAFACYYPSGRTVTCPIWQIQTSIFPFWTTGRGWGVYYTTSGIERLATVSGLIIVMSLVFGRSFCGWICPFGLYMDVLTRVRKVFKKTHLSFSEEANSSLHQLTYVIISLLLILSVILGSQAIFDLQLVSDTQPGGYVNNYFSAPFCQICPMRPLCVLLQSAAGYLNPSYVFSQTTGKLYEAGFFITSLDVIVLFLITVLSLAFRRFWCRICPLGGLTGIFSRFVPFKWASIIRLDKVEERCTKCGICKRVCPPQITEVYENKGGDVTTSACILCLRCVEMCPYEDCLKVNVAGKTVFKSRNWLK